MFTITEFDREEYQRIPFFRNRDAGIIQVWETRKEAQAVIDSYQGTLYKPEIVSADSLPYKTFNMSEYLRTRDLSAR